jgi:hypothetical protein
MRLGTNRKSLLRLLSAAGPVLFLGACATSGGFATRWKDAEWSAPPMKNVYVVALRPDPVKRRMWEDGFTEGLARHGIQATASYRRFPDAPPDTQQVIQEVRANKYDGVLVSVRLPDGEQVTEVPGYATSEPVTARNPYTGAYYTYYREIMSPPRSDVATLRLFQTDFWSAARPGGWLIWSAVVETVEDVNNNLVRNASKQVVDELARVGILPGKSAAK